MQVKMQDLSVASEDQDVLILEKIVSFLEHDDFTLSGIDIKRGRLGLSLFYLLYGDYTKNEHYYLKAVELIGDCAASIGNGYSSFNINLELSEMGRYLEFVKKAYGIDFEGDEVFGFLDEIQSADLQRAIDRGDCDPYTGCLVAGYYFMSRCESDFAWHKKVEEVIYAIRDAASEDDHGRLYWVSQLHGKHEVFLGLSHGNASIILFLHKAGRMLGIQTDLCEELIERAAEFISQNRFNYDEVSKYKALYPTIVGTPEPSPLCWCYGDLGLALAFTKAADMVGLSEKSGVFLSKSHEILELASRRKGYKDTRIGDAGICYGASGTFLMLEYFAQMDAGSNIKALAQEWYDLIPGFAVHPDGICGFKGIFNQQFSGTNVSFNEGIIGIACTILSKRNNDFLALNEFLNIS